MPCAKGKQTDRRCCHGALVPAGRLGAHTTWERARSARRATTATEPGRGGEGRSGRPHELGRGFPAPTPGWGETGSLAAPGRRVPGPQVARRRRRRCSRPPPSKPPRPRPPRPRRPPLRAAAAPPG
ncbi:uncharacterized protein LOC143268680 [Peromyscus maniculatus bairdii]|uniref:uncharacterized protein LOC143268680 n=1 Tax=Peromyscus maniculatus bairdii TaxID=230844 RepID=UPI003FD11EF9